jgi:hypothetical protein
MKQSLISISPSRLIVLGLLSVVLAACSNAGDDLPDTTGAAVFEYVTETNDYKSWDTWPSDQWNDFSVNLVSGEPHGNIVHIYVNDITLEAAENYDGSLPEGSMIVKENYVGTDVNNPGTLDALTVMYKVDGYNPEANDWFWVKVKPNGSVDAEGAVDGCIGCHSQPNNRDYVLRYGFGQEPAVATLQGE